MNHPILAALILSLSACHATPTPTDNASTAAPASQTLLPLIIHSTTGDQRFDVEVASSEAEQEKGLMFRKSVDDNGGMIFPMDPPRIASFWMKNTLVPLDMLFIRTDGTIAFIARNTIPYSREPSSAGIPVAAVLELRGGRAAELGIKEEDKVRWGNCAVPGARSAITLNFCPAN